MSGANGENVAVEIHDSTLESVESEAEGLVVTLSAYVHRSSGTPAVSEGSGWSQTVRLLLARGRHEAVNAPIWLSGGQLTAGGKVHDNLIPIPLETPGNVRLALQGTRGEDIVITGHDLRVVLLNDAKYIEEFPGNENRPQ